MKHPTTVLGIALVSCLSASVMARQGPPPRPAQGAPQGPPSSYPQRPAGDPAEVARGKTIYSVNCGFCHGSDARGGETGPNLIRSQLVLNDKAGELIGPVMTEGRLEKGMPKFDLTPAQVKDVAAFVHSFRVGGYDESRMVPPSILVGNATAGAAYFTKTCASCHSVSGDLKGIGARIADAKALQQTWLMPGSARTGFGGGGGPAPAGPPPGGAAAAPPRMTVVVTQFNGTKVEGRLVRIDDFVVTLMDAEGNRRTFRRDGETPKVEVRDRLQPHLDLLPRYTDTDIHDLTAYLVTVK